MSLGGRFLRGSLYVMTGQAATNVTNFALGLVIARLLGPAEFGVYAFCFAINEFINIVGAFSFSMALIQAREPAQSDYDTASAAYAGLGLLGLLVAGLLAPLLWSQQGPEAAWILLIMAVARSLRQQWQIPEALLERSLRYRTLAWITTLAATLPNAIAVGLAWCGWGATSLALRDVLNAGLLLALAWWVSGYRFRGEVRGGAARRLLRFSWPVFGARSIETLMERLDALAVAAAFGTTPVGLYHQARNLAEVGFIGTKGFERVTLNLYARMQDDPARLTRAWELVNYFLLRAMLAGAAALLVFPEEIVRLLLGEAWREVAPVLRVLALYGGLLPVFHNVKNLLYGLGHTGRMLRLRAIHAALFVLAVGVGVASQSLAWMAGAVLLATAAGLALAWRATRDLVAPLPLRRLLVPGLALALTWALLVPLAPAAALPWFLRPLVPPAVFLGLVLAAEGATVFRELAYLREQLRRSG